MERTDQIYVTRAGDVLDNICYQHYGETSGVVEKVLEANRGLAQRGPVLGTGIRILLPAIESDQTQDVVRLWS
jgi:phage tail protein X